MGKKSARLPTETTKLVAAAKIATANTRVDDAVRRLAQLIGRQMAREAYECKPAKSFRPTKPECYKQS